MGVGICGGKLLYIGWINNSVLLYNTGNYIQYPVTTHNAKEYEKEQIYSYFIYIYIERERERELGLGVRVNRGKGGQRDVADPDNGMNKIRYRETA